jgi:uncharacterized membrane protein
MLNTSHFHPIMVHFPIALLIVGFAADVISLFVKSEKCLSKTGFYLMVIGALSALVTWLTGHLFTNPPSAGEMAEVFAKHETAATLTLILIIVGAGFRVWLVSKKKETTKLKWIVFGLFLFAVLSISVAGYMGGIMVYGF